MSKSLKIAGIERWPDLESKSLKIEQALTYSVDACSFSVKGDMPSEGEEVIVEQDGIRYFAGIIIMVELAKTFVDKSIKVWKVDCDDYTPFLDRRLVVETYENMPADEIFRDVVEKYCPGFTSGGIQSGAPTVEYMVFNYLRPSECFKQLCDYVGWHWQPDYYKDLKFFSPESLASQAPLTLEPRGPFRFKKHSIDTQGLRNRVYVRGGTMLSDLQILQWKADGVARTWVLPWKPYEADLSVGAVPQSVGVENVDEEESNDYMLNLNEKYVRCSTQTATPVEGTTISLTARQDIDVITMIEDLVSQTALAAVQGGDGVYEHTITDDSLVTIAVAEAAGYADLREHANPRVKGTFETETPGWAPGQLVTINLPDRGVSGTFLVQKVNLSPSWNNPSFWSYQVEYGGRLLGIADFLRALVSAQQNKKTNDTSILQKFVYGSEQAAVADELIITSRGLPFLCGDTGVICGLVVLSNG